MTNKLKFAELKKLIELCGEKGVSELQLGELKVVFGGKTNASSLTPTVRQTKVTEVQSQQIEKQGLAEASMELDDEALALMQIENPVLYEQMLIEGELEDDGNGSELRDNEQSAIDSSALQSTSETTQYQ